MLNIFCGFINEVLLFEAIPTFSCWYFYFHFESFWYIFYILVSIGIIDYA